MVPSSILMECAVCGIFPGASDGATCANCEAEWHRPRHDPWMTDPCDVDYLEPEERWCIVCGRPDRVHRVMVSAERVSAVRCSAPMGQTAEDGSRAFDYLSGLWARTAWHAFGEFDHNQRTAA